MATSLKDSKNRSGSRKFTQIPFIWWKDRDNRSSRSWDNLSQIKKKEINASKIYSPSGKFAERANYQSTYSLQFHPHEYVVKLTQVLIDACCTRSYLVNSELLDGSLPNVHTIETVHCHLIFSHRRCDPPIHFGTSLRWIKVGKQILPIWPENWLRQQLRPWNSRKKKVLSFIRINISAVEKSSLVLLVFTIYQESFILFPSKFSPPKFDAE